MRICGMEHDLIQKPWAPEEAKRPLLQALLKSGRLLSCQLPRSRFWLSQLLAAPLQLRMRVDWDPTLDEDPRLNWQPRQLWVVLWWLSGFTNHVLFWGLDFRLGACKIRTSLLLEGQLPKSWVHIGADIFAIRKELFEDQGCMLPRLSLCAFHVLTTAFHTLPQRFVTDCAHWFSALIAETPRWQPAPHAWWRHHYVSTASNESTLLSLHLGSDGFPGLGPCDALPSGSGLFCSFRSSFGHSFGRSSCHLIIRAQEVVQGSLIDGHFFSVHDQERHCSNDDMNSSGTLERSAAFSLKVHNMHNGRVLSTGWCWVSMCDPLWFASCSH